MSRRSDNISFKVMPNGNIRAFQADTKDKRGVSEMNVTNPRGVSPTIITMPPMFYKLHRVCTVERN